MSIKKADNFYDMEMCLSPAMVDMLRPVMGSEWKAFLKALQQPPVVSIRVNRGKTVLVPTEVSVPWCAEGFYLSERQNFTNDPWLHAGAYYVQEASSMFLAQVLQHFCLPTARCLDLCAAPGGKSLIVADHVHKGGLLVSNEINRTRCSVLVENITKWGLPHVLVTNDEPADFERLGAWFDLVLVDAPCSGEGMLRKEPQVLTEWSRESVRKCVMRQWQILQSAWRVLQPGGILIYSTCTYNVHEDEEQVRRLLQEVDAELLSVPLQVDWGVIDTGVGYRFVPHRTRGEGLFMAVVRKNSHGEKLRHKTIHVKHVVKECAMSDMLQNADHYTAMNFRHIVLACPKPLTSAFDELLNTLRVVQCGVPLFAYHGQSLVPQPALALSQCLRRDAFIGVEVDDATALAFLRGEALRLSTQQRGYVLVIYRGLPLGFVHNIGTRCNNLYPSPWRIRMATKAVSHVLVEKA